MEKIKITKKQEKEAKNNGFIVLGKTGVGKSNFLNALTGNMVAKSERSLKPVTTETSIIYYKLNNNKWILLIDTPGLSDPKKNEDKEYDNKTLKKIAKCIENNNIRVKGLLFLTNFQIERFDADEQKTLVKYNQLFPLKKFWEYVIIIYTHYYGDDNGGITKEEIKKERAKSNSQVFEEFMERVKNVSNVIPYNQLDIKYSNLYFPTKNKIQEENNKNFISELEQSLIKLYEKEPLFCKIHIAHFTNCKYKNAEDGKIYYGDFEIYGYFDVNTDKPIKEQFKPINVREIQKEEKVIDEPKLEVEEIKVEENEDKNLDYKVVKNPKDSYYYKIFKGIVGGVLGGGLGAAGGLGLIVGGLAAPVVPVIGLGGIILGAIGGIIGANS